MEANGRSTCTAFVGTSRVASGTRAEVASAAREALQRGATSPVLVFDDATGEQIDIDLRAAGHELPQRSAAGNAQPPATPDGEARAETRGPGRPRLGVVAREVTLLPRHWEWLAGQPGGASVALRKLVEHARKANEETDRRRRAQDAAYRFMSAIAGDLAGYEEAIRALFSGDRGRFDEFTASWPPDVGEYARALATEALD